MIVWQAVRPILPGQCSNQGLDKFLHSGPPFEPPKGFANLRGVVECCILRALYSCIAVMLLYTSGVGAGQCSTIPLSLK